MDVLFWKTLFRESENSAADIHTAASIGSEEWVQEIIKNSDDRNVVNRLNRKIWTPLMYAACCANFKVSLNLIKEGAKTDMKNNEGQTALTLASKCGCSDIVNLLIDCGANVNSADNRGWSALFHAVAFGHRSVVQLLIKRGALLHSGDDNRFKVTPLMIAAAAGQEIIVKDLLQMGVDINTKSCYGDTAQSLALKNGHLRIKDLIDAHSFSVKNDVLSIVNFPDLFSLLKHLELLKYYHVFESHNIDLRTFWLLTDEDLKDIGIKLLGPRKKMCVAISKYHREKCSYARSEGINNVQNDYKDKKLQH